ncbi:hypothetical protein [Deinococcus rubellus]|uniref:DoxX family protein n=1 Tax=Deinococcus rubellus TaxID=1889240 RepID=A0ABY5YIN9_9DEIO|nr:hypothetical protein [Deinococcus rubellus]UWX64207.1 hypothetical protein N0D28_00575 [Deinococcus rubellus]
MEKTTPRVSRNLTALRTPSTDLHHPPLRWWHTLMLVSVLALGALAIRAPGVLADIGSVVVADWRVFIMVRETVVIFSLYALVFVRSYTPLVGFGLLASCVGLLLRLGITQVTHEPLSLGYLVILITLCVLPVRVIVRPNDTDRIKALEMKERVGE